ncbi:hypothetical protein GRX66_10545, partial [Halobacterium sp. PCN9]|nr:hypothetical protein [Halobacterium bonnevillei]
NVIGAVGEVNNVSKTDVDISETSVYEIRTTLQKSPGAGDVDLAGLSIQYVGPDGFGNLVHVSETNISAENVSNAYFVQAITAETEEDTVMTSESDRYELVIPTGTNLTTADATSPAIPKTESGDQVATKEYGTDTDIEVDLTNSEYGVDNTDLDLLKEGNNVELTITTESGSQRYVNLQVPDSLVGDEGSTVQL